MAAIISWISAHQACVAGAVVGILDLVMALIPGLAANGILHQLLLWAQAIAAKGSSSGTPPAAS